MTDLKKAAQQALEALEARAVNRYFEHLGETIAALKAALEQPEQEPVAWMAPRNDIITCNGAGTRFNDWIPLYTHPPRRETEPAFDALVAISLLTHLGGEVADYEDVVEAVRRLHALNGELGAALRRLISYCNTLENRLMEADGEHPAVQEAKEAWAKVEGKV
jgi:HPt (histidine-containing phosphotransfer) domain-containing protein